MSPSYQTIRLFVDAPLSAGAEVALHEGQVHYLRHVMRCPEDASLTLFNGRDGAWSARVRWRGKRDAVAVPAAQTAQQRSAADLWLLFAPLKHGRIDFLVEKATELGVSALAPVWTKHSNVSRVNLERLTAQTIEAAEQCERLDVPVFLPERTLEHWLGDWPAGRTLLYADESGNGLPIAERLTSLTPSPLTLLTGPEGGFSSQEHVLLRACPHAVSVSLGPRVMRAETAALAGLACIQAWLGDWRGERPRWQASPEHGPNERTAS